MHAQTTGGTGALRELLHEANRAGLDATGRERIAQAVNAASGPYAATLPAGDDVGAREASAALATTIRVDK